MIIPELQVALKIYEITVINEQPTWYAQLKEIFNETISRDRFDRIHDILYDMGVIKGAWLCKPDGRWVRSLSITNDYINFIEDVYLGVQTSNLR